VCRNLLGRDLAEDAVAGLTHFRHPTQSSRVSHTGPTPAPPPRLPPSRFSGSPVRARRGQPHLASSSRPRAPRTRLRAPPPPGCLRLLPGGTPTASRRLLPTARRAAPRPCSRPPPAALAGALPSGRAGGIAWPPPGPPHRAWLPLA